MVTMKQRRKKLERVAKGKRVKMYEIKTCRCGNIFEQHMDEEPVNLCFECELKKALKKATG